MGLFSFFKGGQGNLESSVNLNKDRVAELQAFIEDIRPTLQTDYQRRVKGDGVYSGYDTLRQFYKGQQWSYKKSGGGTMRTYNYVFTVVENMTAFLTNEPPQISSPPRKLDDPVERALADARSRLLEDVHEQNYLPLVFQKAARIGSITGDTMIFGPIPIFKVDDKGNKTLDEIRYWNVERPETIRIIWKDENFSEIAGFIKSYRIALSQAKRLFEKEIQDSGMTLHNDQDVNSPISGVQPTDQPMVTVEEYWDEREYLLSFNTGKTPIHYVKHDWGFVPLQWIPNIHLPGEAKGTSDIEHELDPQQEYNERTSDLADVIKELAFPAYWGTNIDNLTEVRSGQTVIYQVGEDGKINAMPKSGQSFALEQYLGDRKNDIIAISGLNSVLYPSNNVMQATGRALSVIMQGVNNKIALRKEWWVKAFKEINKGILYHLEQWLPESKAIIDGYYKTDVFISSVLLRSVSDEINKFQAKLQSLTTTQHNVGVPNPGEEQKLMKEELNDDILATEIAKNPQLLHQVIAERTANAQAAMQQPGIPGGPMGAPPSGTAPVAGEGQNIPGENPAPIRGQASPVSAAGRNRQIAQRSGAPSLVKKK